MAQRAVCLDKDGTLIEDVPYSVDPAQMRLAPGAAAGLPRLRDAGFRLFVISNQPGVAHGLFAEEALEAVKDRLCELLASLGVTLDGFYYCPHHPEATVPRDAVTCGCRKPQPGLILAAARAGGVVLDQSWFIGDILDDVEAGRRAGCRTVHIDNRNETCWRRSPLRWPDFVAVDLADAARVITDADRSRRA
jgi:histidinol-phosphate phosphatase family protein